MGLGCAPDAREPLRVAVVEDVPDCGNAEPADSVLVVNARSRADDTTTRVSLTVSYLGGCETHEVRFCWMAAGAGDTRRELRVVHDAFGDTCQDEQTEHFELRFPADTVSSCETSGDASLSCEVVAL